MRKILTSKKKKEINQIQKCNEKRRIVDPIVSVEGRVCNTSAFFGTFERGREKRSRNKKTSMSRATTIWINVHERNRLVGLSKVWKANACDVRLLEFE